MKSKPNRTHIHTRQVIFHSYFRDDGLWDFEAELIDTKPFAFITFGDIVKEANDPIHRIIVCTTVDDSMTVRSVSATMPNTPFPECIGSLDFLQNIVGLNMTAGWRKSVAGAIGGVTGCTHIRELLFNMATVAFQTIPSYRQHQRRNRNAPIIGHSDPAPHLGKCHALALDGDVLQRFKSEFYPVKN